VIQPQSPDGDGNVPDPEMDSFTTTFNLPLLTIIPINSLGVDDVDINFEMEVKSSFGEEQSEETKNHIQASASWKVKAKWGPVSCTVKGKASYDHEDSTSHSTHYQKSNSAKYTVKVHAGQLPVPKGVNTIIEAYTQSIQPIQMPAPDNSNDHNS
jgi:hypothetical protein